MFIGLNMKTSYWIVIGSAVFFVMFGLCILSVMYNAPRILEVSVTWIVELEPHLDLTDKQLMRQMQNEDTGELQIFKVRHLEDYFDMHASASFVNVVGDLPPTENRYVLYIHEDTIRSSDETNKILTEIDGIVDAKSISYKISATPPSP